MWKTSFGGFITVIFVFVVLSYIAISADALRSGDMDWVDSYEADMSDSNRLSFKQMTVMPVVTFNMLTPHIYLDSHTLSFKKNIFVAVL